MAHIGYVRVSTLEQNASQQLQDVVLDKVFEEKISSLADPRPVLAECLNYLREGDTLHVHSIDRLARSLIELQNLVEQLKAKGVTVCFQTENMTFSGVHSPVAPMQELLFQVLGAFAQFERNLIKERQREGIAKAKKEGRQLGRPRKISLTAKEEILAKLQTGASPAALAKEYGVSLSSIHKLKSLFSG